MHMGSADNLMFALLLLLAGVATLLFIHIQRYLNHPLHAQWRDEWFAQFSANLARRYRENGMSWRVDVIERCFARQK